jgi:hypothetical protein
MILTVCKDLRSPTVDQRFEISQQGCYLHGCELVHDPVWIVFGLFGPVYAPSGLVYVPNGSVFVSIGPACDHCGPVWRVHNCPYESSEGQKKKLFHCGPVRRESSKNQKKLFSDSAKRQRILFSRLLKIPSTSTVKPSRSLFGFLFLHPLIIFPVSIPEKYSLCQQPLSPAPPPKLRTPLLL